MLSHYHHHHPLWPLQMPLTAWQTSEAKLDIERLLLTSFHNYPPYPPVRACQTTVDLKVILHPWPPSLLPPQPRKERGVQKNKINYKERIHHVHVLVNP